MSSRLLATVVAGLLCIATPARVVSELRPRVEATVDLLCVLIGLPVNNFTRVAAPIQMQDGRMRPGAVPISVTYGPGFAAYPQAQAAFQYAVEIWRFRDLPNRQITKPPSPPIPRSSTDDR